MEGWVFGKYLSKKNPEKINKYSINMNENVNEKTSDKDNPKKDRYADIPKSNFYTKLN